MNEIHKELKVVLYFYSLFENAEFLVDPRDDYEDDAISEYSTVCGTIDLAFAFNGYKNTKYDTSEEYDTIYASYELSDSTNKLIYDVIFDIHDDFCSIREDDEHRKFLESRHSIKDLPAWWLHHIKCNDKDFYDRDKCLLEIKKSIRHSTDMFRERGIS